jgi:hypothetical protein
VALPVACSEVAVSARRAGRSSLSALLAILGFCAPSAWAQPALSQVERQAPAAVDDIDPASLPPPLTLTYTEGTVEIVRASGVEPAAPPDILEEDARLVIAEGRAELVVADGALAHVDRSSDLRVDLGVRLRLVSGRLVVHTPYDAEPLVVATPAGLVELGPDGEYDLTADDLRGDTTIGVVTGRASWLQGDHETTVEPGDVLLVHPRDDRARWARGRPSDEFLDWARRRAATMTSSTAPTALPPPMRPWGADLAMYGQWSTMAPYGAVWYPRAMAGWRPYTYGSWRFTRYGWTWIDRDRWAWPLHHYGRWGHHDVRGWYWIPDHVWGPAWVGWAVAADHIAWSPLGWNARPLVDFSFGLRVGPIGLWLSSWSIVPRRAFGSRGPAWTQFQDPHRLPGPVLGGFVSQLIGPRGPASGGDRFAVQPERRYGRTRSTTPGWAQPRPAPGSLTPRPADDRVVDAPGEAIVRRPGDAAPRAPAEPGTAAPVERPRERQWSTRPSDRVDERRGNGRPVMPVGPPVRPRDEPSGASGEAGRGEAPRERAVPRRAPDAGTASGAAGRARPGDAGTTSGTGRNDGGRERPQGGIRRPPASDPGAAGGDRGASSGSARRRSG